MGIYNCQTFSMNQSYYRPPVHLFMEVRVSLTSVLNFLQLAKGSLNDNRKYCTKENNFLEHGELPAYLMEKEQQQKTNKQVMEDWLKLSNDEFESKWPYQTLRWRRKLMEWEASRTTQAKAWDGDLQKKNFWIYGPPGNRKSRWARAQVIGAQYYCKLCNKWWGRYDRRDHRLVLMEDFPLCKNREKLCFVK